MKTGPLAALAALIVAAPLVARPLTPQDLVTLSRLSDPALSPDGRWVAYQQRETDLEDNLGRTDLYLLDLAQAGGAPTRFASTADHNESAPAFSADGRAVYFLSNRSGSQQVWMAPVAGGAAVQVTRLARDVGGFSLSPAADRIALWVDEREDCARPVCGLEPPKLDAGTGRTYDKLFVRHWDTWRDGTRSRLLTATLQGGVAAGPLAWVSRALDGDVPSKPFGGNEEVAWAPDGRTLYFALRQAGRTEAWSTDLDIFSVPANGNAAPVNLTAGRDGMDTLPAVSPDGRWLAWGSMARPTYEADRLVIHLRDLKSGAVRAVANGWDRSVESIAWAPNSQSLLVTARDHYDRPVFQVDVATGKPRRLTGEGSASAVLPRGPGAVYALDSLTAPADLHAIDEYGESRRLTRVNAARLTGIDMPVATRFSFKGAAGDTVWGYALKPAGLAADARVPIAFLIHGGPQSTFGNAFSYRWNPAVFAGAGYGAVLIDFHGSVGYGQAFTDSINQDWGGKPLDDLKLGLAAATRQFKWLDGERACALGGSYGGYMVNWIAGQWPDRFGCLVNHAGVFDSRAMAFETEELWFDEWEHGGTYWEKPETYEKSNPVHHVTRWRSPMLVIHGEKDFRIPYTQALAAFTALQRQGIDSRLVIFPDENHWILKPRNSLQWHAEVLGWMDRHVGKGR
jgi:dipeptidyl aminopeptidase/acylaminoacyl peptidase